MLETWGLGRRFGRATALAGVDLALPAARVLAVLGPNGSGKTTLLRLLAGAIRPTAGGARVAGHDLEREPEEARSAVALLGHGSYLYEELSALENLRFVAAMRGLAADRASLLPLLDAVGLGPAADRRVRAFSAGMKRRLGLARLRLLRPRLLLVDEPYAGLDQTGGTLFETVVAEALGRGASVVMATHQIARAHALADRIAILAGNRLAYEGPTDATDLDGLRGLYARCTEEGGVPGGPLDQGAAPAGPTTRVARPPAVPSGTAGAAARPHGLRSEVAGTPLSRGAPLPLEVVTVPDVPAPPPAGAPSPPRPAPPPAAGFLRRAGALVWKDFTVERRTKESTVAMLFFAALVLFIFAFALGPDRAKLRDAAPGLLWVAFVFTGVLGLARAFQAERENDALEGLLLHPGDKGAIYLGKLAGSLIFVGAVELLVVPLMAVFYNLDLWPVAPAILGVALLGTLGFCAVGTLYSALTANYRFREVLLPLLLLPATVPVLLGGVEATGALVRDGALGAAGRWLGVLAAFDVVYLTACLLLFEYVIED